MRLARGSHQCIFEVWILYPDAVAEEYDITAWPSLGVTQVPEQGSSEDHLRFELITTTASPARRGIDYWVSFVISNMFRTIYTLGINANLLNTLRLLFQTIPCLGIVMYG